ncbi:MAG: sigma 54-interacting transcriptional regulator [Halioglobus sp.]
MLITSSDRSHMQTLGHMLEGYDCPAILVSAEYEILATNTRYRETYGDFDVAGTPRCYAISHGYSVPCDQAGEDCPLKAANTSGHKERVLHIHQTPRGAEHVDVQMVPIQDAAGELIFFIELLKPIPLASGIADDAEMVGKSAPFNKMLSKIARVGPSDAAVLLLGESGTGKELAAKAIHLASDRKDQALVTLECAGLTDSLFESELFGHVKGAFTGAQFNKKGLVELANGGTLFLDEIGDVPLTMQVKLLRLLESGTFRAVGSAKLCSSDFRLICATHKNLPEMVERGEFRRDLYYRINVFPIRMPALAQRLEDIPLLAKALLARMSKKKSFHFTNSAIEALCNHPFKGNIRELRNLLQRAIVLADTNLIDHKLIEECIDEGRVDEEFPPPPPEQVADRDSWTDLKTAEREYLLRLMQAYDNDKTRVAKTAGISLRSLYRKISR